MVITNKSLYLIGILALTGWYSCVPVKNIRAENKNVPEHYQDLSGDSLNSATIRWREFFSDANLVALIDTALLNNQELNITLQRVAIAQNEIKARKGAYLPFVNAYARGDVEKAGQFTRDGAVEENLNIKEGKGFPEPLPDVSLGLAASWEVDVWKKLRNAKKAAVLEYLAGIEGRNFTVTRLVAEIAGSYYELMALDNQLSLIDSTLAIQRNALEMVKLQQQAARTTSLAVKRFEAEVLKNQSHKYEIHQQIVEAENRINFLIGRTPRPIARHSEDFVERPLDTLYAGVPSQLLQNRPDIRQAEYELEAAKINVKVARANFYPSFGLTATFGLQAFRPKYLTHLPESIAYSLTRDIVGPLINRNAIKAEYNTANAKQLQAIFEYERAILRGYIEVTNQLANLDNLKNSYTRKHGQVEALKESTQISMMLFQSARVEYIEVLLAQREALQARMELVETRKAQLLARIHMYQALGGGWK